MRARIISAAILCICLVPQSAHAAACKVGETVTLEGEIIIPPILDGEDWFWPGKFARNPCEVVTIRGKGKLPEECVVGKSMAVTGRVVRDGVLILQIASVRCFSHW